MKTAWTYTIVALALLAIAVFGTLGWRGKESKDPPVQFWGDMADQPKFRPQSRNPFFADGRAQRDPAPGTVPYGRRTGGPDPKLAEDDRDAFVLERMPVEFDAALIERGRGVYGRFCALCHGLQGDGNGITTKYGMTNPTSYHTERLRGLSDGAVYQVITEGKGQMGPLGGRVPPDDRWAAVAWVRVLQRAQQGSIDDVPDSDRGELE